MAGSTTLEEILSSCLSPENLRRTQAEAALKVSLAYPLSLLHFNNHQPTHDRCMLVVMHA